MKMYVICVEKHVVIICNQIWTPVQHEKYQLLILLLGMKENTEQFSVFILKGKLYCFKHYLIKLPKMLLIFKTT